MSFEEYPFDVTRLWEARKAREEAPETSKLTKRTRSPRAMAEVVSFPRVMIEPEVDAEDCRASVHAELTSIALSLKLRDMLRRNGIADRCASCGKCPDMAG